MVDLNKLAVQDRVKKAYKQSPKDTDATAKRTCIENDSANPVPTEDVHSKNIKIFNVDINAGQENVEQSQALLSGTRRVIIKVRKKVDTTLKIASVANGTTSNEFIQVEPGGYLDLDDLNLIGKTVYFQADKPNRTIEILTLY